jgi:hypothetical protein
MRSPNSKRRLQRFEFSLFFGSHCLIVFDEFYQTPSTDAELEAGVATEDADESGVVDDEQQEE